MKIIHGTPFVRWSLVTERAADSTLHAIPQFAASRSAPTTPAHPSIKSTMVDTATAELDALDIVLGLLETAFPALKALLSWDDELRSVSLIFPEFC
jgi:hypothetical protein